MAKEKVTYAKLKLQKNIEVKTIEFNGFEIEIKQYLPIEEKLTLISNVINASYDEQNYSNPIKEDVYGTLEIIYAYTNIIFTDKQKEDATNLYDTLISSGLADRIIAEIPKPEYQAIVDGINKCITAIYAYRNSVLGILDVVSNDYNGLNFDVNQLSEDLSNPENLTLLKDVLTKLG